MSRIAVLVTAVLISVFLSGCWIDAQPEQEQPAFVLVWQWDAEQTYNKGDRCWLGIDPETELRMDWESLQDGNLGHRPVMYGTEPLSPEWWVRIR